MPRQHILIACEKMTKPTMTISREQNIAPALYLVATPIGNLRDISLRALDILHAADLIACEDTRITTKLCQAYGIKTPLLSYHDHNAHAMRPKILQALEAQKIIALVSDAGTPLISDPGYGLVRAVIENGHKLVPIRVPVPLLRPNCLRPANRSFYVFGFSAKTTAQKN